MINRNCLSYWLPLVQGAGVPVPETRIVHAPSGGLFDLLDGKLPEGWMDFLGELGRSVAEIGGMPCFLRTGQTSGKHQWKHTCYLADIDLLGRHVANLVEFSALADLMGLPDDIWAVRKLLKTIPLFEAFGGFPVTREFRAFVEDGKVVCIHPYWPAGAIDGNTETDGWKQKLDAASVLGADEDSVQALAERAGAVLPVAWSVDLLQDADGKWWVTDCADAGCSFHWEGCPNGDRWPRRIFVEDQA